MGKDDDTITVTKSDLAAMLEDAKREASMSDDEKEVRRIVREESEGIFRKVLGEFFSSGDDDENDNRPGGVGRFLGIASGS